MTLCTTCLENDEEVAGTVREGGYEPMCDDCYQNAAEKAFERMVEDFYGGGGPMTIHEKHQAADRERRDLRRRD